MQNCEVKELSITEPVIDSEVSQKEKNKYLIITHIYNLEKWY